MVLFSNVMQSNLVNIHARIQRTYHDNLIRVYKRVEADRQAGPQDDLIVWSLSDPAEGSKWKKQDFMHAA